MQTTHLQIAAWCLQSWRALKMPDAISLMKASPVMWYSPSSIALRPDLESRCEVVLINKWCQETNVEWHYIQPGKSMENAIAESFIRSFRDECLNKTLFTSLSEAGMKISNWKENYNNQRPYSSLGNLMPNEFAMKWALKNLTT